MPQHTPKEKAKNRKNKPSITNFEKVLESLRGAFGKGKSSEEAMKRVKEARARQR